MCSAAFSCGRSSRLFQMRTDISCCVRTSAKNWQTQPLQGASVAVVTLLHLWCMSAGKIVVHLVGHLLGLLPQLWGQVNPFATPCRCVEKDVLWNIADKHLFQSHSLCAKLQPICIARFRETVLIFHRQRQPAPGIFLKRPPSGSEWNSTTSHFPEIPRRGENTGSPRRIRSAPRRSRCCPSWARLWNKSPSTVRRFSFHCCSMWMRAHWRRQKARC